MPWIRRILALVDANCLPYPERRGFRGKLFYFNKVIKITIWMFPLVGAPVPGCCPCRYNLYPIWYALRLLLLYGRLQFYLSPAKLTWSVAVGKCVALERRRPFFESGATESCFYIVIIICYMYFPWRGMRTAGRGFPIHPEQASKMQKDKCKGKRFLHTDMPTPQ